MPHHIILQPQPESFTRLPDQSRFSELQALRAIAAAMVVFDHAVVTWYDKLAGTAAPATALHLSAFGVKLFFCISGFIIFNSVWNLWAGWPSVKNFAVRRLIRIVPLYWCITLIYAGKLSLQGSSPTIVQLFQSLFFIPYSHSPEATAAEDFMFPVLGAGWTLNYEMFFYIVLTASLWLSPRRRLLVVVSGMVGLFICRVTGLLPTEGGFARAIFLLSDSYLLFFVAGILVSHARNSADATATGLKRSGLTLPGIALLVTGGAVTVALVGQSSFRIPLEIMLCTVCVMWCVSLQSRADTAHPSLFQRWIVLAGDSSYSTYLIHGFVMGLTARAANLVGLTVAPWLFAWAMVILCTGAGMVVYRYFERPLLASLNARWRAFHAAPATV